MNITLDQFIEQLSQKDHFILAIDGMCASGKTTLAYELAQKFNANVFHMDDFYLPQELRTSQRFMTPGENIHHERFLETVLKPLSQKQTVYYQKFDCSNMSLSSQVIEIPYRSFNIIEGSYALHHKLIKYYSDCIVLKISPEMQIERLKKRNPDQINMFQEKWIPLENEYFDTYHLFEKYPVITF